MNFNYLIFFSFMFTFLSCQTDKQKDSKTNTKETKSSIKSEEKFQLFTKLGKEYTGIGFINHNKESSVANYYTYEYFYNGGGVAVADFNNDGLQDIAFSANMSPNKLYINKGNLKFEDISQKANINVQGPDWCSGINVVDINQDGFQDIIVLRSGWWSGKESINLRNLLFINNGDLTFSEKGKEYGFTDLSHTTNVCFFDKDNDGDLDAYFINHPSNFYAVGFTSIGTDVNVESPGALDRLYENQNGKFIDITKKLNLKGAGFGLGVIASDFNNDGWQDLYVSNDYRDPDYVLINQKNGKFKNENATALKHMSKFSMGVDVADINNDGLQDIFNAEMLAKDNLSKKANMAPMNTKMYDLFIQHGYLYQDMHNSLQLNNGNGTFSEISWLANVAESGWSWSPLIADFDNDGHKDLFTTNGYKRDMLNKDFSKKSDQIKRNLSQFDNLKNSIPNSITPNNIFKNNGDLTFEDKTKQWGLNVPMNSNGAAYADFDNDGDLDIVVNNIEQEAAIFQNNINNKQNYLNIKLKNDNKTPYGAKVEILDKGYYQMIELSNVHGYQSTSESILHFGLGDKKNIDSLLISWSNNKTSLLTNLKSNQLKTLDFKDSNFITLKKPKSKKYFTDVTKKVNVKYTHKEKDYDDYKREILLPHKLSQEGPFIDVADVNGDGLDDFFVGNGVGFAGELYLQSKTGNFLKSKQVAFQKDYNSEDLGVLFFDFDSDGDQDLYVVSGSNEHTLQSEFMQDRLYQNDGKGNFTKTKNIIPQMPASGSCVKSTDFDNDGDLDLFVGGFQIPGQYPKAGNSYLLQNNNGVFKDVTNQLAVGLQTIGMVKDALFTDVNNDGKQDLIVTGQWMPITLYIYDENKFINKTKQYGLDKHVGWFNSLESIDINNDNFPEIIAGNLGLNIKHKASQAEPFKIYAADFDGNGTNDIVLGYYNEGICYPVRGKQCSSEQMPSISKKIPTYNQFGLSNLNQIYGKENLEKATHYDATYFQTSILNNINGNKYELKSLPNEVQFAPTNGILSLDVNKDGYKDILTVGNHYPVEVETGRSDAHTGNLLLSNNNNLENISNSSFFIDKDARCIKSITINNNKHIIISSNRNSLSFFKQTTH